MFIVYKSPSLWNFVIAAPVDSDRKYEGVARWA